MSEMTRVQAPSNLPALVKAAFQKARANGDLLYYPTQVTILNVGTVPFQLRFSPALASKPKAPPKPDGEQPGAARPPFNPFASPAPGLLVARLPPAHNLVLNKFAVVPEHFILATAEVRPQTHVLEAADVDAAYACVEAYANADTDAAEGGRDLFVFFNSGEHSGASQPHRHLQLLPVARMRDGLESVERGDAWRILTDTLTGHDGGQEKEQAPLPFTVFSTAINPGMSAQARHEAYVDLYRRAVSAVAPGTQAPAEGEARISYNFAMTRTAMALCPRTAEGAAIADRAGRPAGHVALNGTLLAGTALVKTQAEWDALGGDPDLLRGVLEKIGIRPP